MLKDTNPQHWKLGFVYYNPDEDSLFIAKRTGAPVTLNFAKPAAWVISAVLPTIAIVGFIVDRLHSVR